MSKTRERHKSKRARAPLALLALAGKSKRFYLSQEEQTSLLRDLRQELSQETPVSFNRSLSDADYSLSPTVYTAAGPARPEWGFTLLALAPVGDREQTLAEVRRLEADKRRRRAGK